MLAQIILLLAINFLVIERRFQGYPYVYRYFILPFMLLKPYFFFTMLLFFFYSFHNNIFSSIFYLICFNSFFVIINRIVQLQTNSVAFLNEAKRLEI